MLKLDRMKNMVKKLDECGDKYCGNIITLKKIKEEDIKFLRNVRAKCLSKKIPKTRSEDKAQQKKYNKCFTKYKRRSNYQRKLTMRKHCETKKCGSYQTEIQKLLRTP